MKTFSTFTKAERIAYDRVFLETRNAIEDSIILLDDQIQATGDVQKKWQLGLVRDSLQSQLDMLNMEYDAIARDGFGVTPPTPQQVAAISKLAQDVASLTGQAARASDAVSLAQKALALYSKLKA